VATSPRRPATRSSFKRKLESRTLVGRHQPAPLAQSRQSGRLA
jgi:hypothetical protein